MIQNIKIDKLFPHPSNPRQDLGDMTELADSIKANGVMQNLTVVEKPSPNRKGYCMSCQRYNRSVGKCQDGYDEKERPPCSKWKRSDLIGSWISTDDYIVVIGHRRLAAAKLAGLEELPCSVVEMSERQQISTMLLENMQRADLTVYEQAHGFQMMLDLGDTVVSIAQQTGFSETTVRKRVKLLELDQEKFKASQAKGATLMDYIKLSKIEDIKKRNEVLDKFGTNDFQWKLGCALNDQKEKHNRPLIKKELLSFATMIEEKNTGKYEFVNRVDLISYEPGKLIPKDAGKKKYYFTWDPERSYNVVLYKEKAKKESERRPQEEIDLEKAVHQTEAELQKLTIQAYEMRYEFLSNLAVKKTQIQDVLELLCKAEFYAASGYCGFNDKAFKKAFGLDQKYRTILEIYKDYAKAYDDDPLKAAVFCMWCVMGDNDDQGYFRKNYGGQRMPEHITNMRLDLIYEFLQKLDYEMSTEEKALQDGTHELFPEKKEGEEADVDEEDDDDEEDEEEE